LGFLAMRSHSTAPGILAHGMINGSAYLLLLNFIPILR
jgi:membrane protease YdiL (CAAX protease family)